MVKKTVEPMGYSSSLPIPSSLKPKSTTNGNNIMDFDNTAKQMADLKAIIFNTPETNQTKIQFIKEELSADRYQIHCHHIASKLLEYAELQEEAEMA